MTLKTERLGLERGGLPVLADVSASFAPGAITAIVGPNGAGKSSLLLALAGLLEPGKGRVTLDGRDVARLPARERARSIGYLPQDARIAWDVSVENLVALGRMPHRDRGREPIEKALATLDLGHLRHRPSSKLSGGEKARVLLARVLAGEPRWILADEPLAALDLAHRDALLSHLAACATEGRGVVIVLHDLAIAMNRADHVLVLDKGRLAAEGDPQIALDEDVVRRVWGVKARWTGAAGERALVTRSGRYGPL